MESNQSHQPSGAALVEPEISQRACPYCRRPLQRKPGEPQGHFLKRQFCNRRHEKRFRVVGQAKPDDPVLLFESSEPLPSPPPPSAVKRMADVEHCPKCGSRALWADGPFVACLCGVRIPAKDGDWQREAWRPRQTSWMDLPSASPQQASIG